MSMTVSDDPPIIEGVPPGIEGQEGAEMISAFGYPGYATLQPGEDVDLQRVDWASFQAMTQDEMHTIGDNLRQTAAENGAELLAYVLYRSTDTVVGIPNQICMFGWCWTPPLAGTAFVQANHYRLWSMTRPMGAAYANPHVRALGPLLIIAIAGSLIAMLAVIVGIQQMQQGRIKWSEVSDFVHGVITAPGEVVAGPIQAAAWPLAALGISMVLASIVFPIAVSHINVNVPLGPASISGGLETGTRSGTPVRDNRRR